MAATAESLDKNRRRGLPWHRCGVRELRRRGVWDMAACRKKCIHLGMPHSVRHPTGSFPASWEQSVRSSTDPSGNIDAFGKKRRRMIDGANRSNYNQIRRCYSPQNLQIFPDPIFSRSWTRLFPSCTFSAKSSQIAWKGVWFCPLTDEAPTTNSMRGKEHVLAQSAKQEVKSSRYRAASPSDAASAAGIPGVAGSPVGDRRGGTPAGGTLQLTGDQPLVDGGAS